MPDNPNNIVPLTGDAKRVAQEFGAAHDRELLTILFTDLVDSTKLQSELGNVEAARLTELHRAIVRDELARYDAREIEWAGDSCLAVFTKPSDAVVFALRMQAEHWRVRETEPKLPLVRVGMHLGEVVVRKGEKKDDLFGLQVSEAARVMSVARGGQVYCTRTVFDNARNALRGTSIQGIKAIDWLSHGLFELKGSEVLVEICEAIEKDFTRFEPPLESDKCRPAIESEAASRRRAPSRTMLGSVAVIVAVVLLPVFAFAPWRQPAEPDTAGSANVADGDLLDSLTSANRVPMSLAPDLPVHFPGVADTPLALSPDGKQLVYLADAPNGNQLVLQRRGDLEPEILRAGILVDRPFFSPDGSWIGYLGNEDGWKVFRKPASGGASVLVVDVPLNLPARWSDDGYIYYTPTFGSGIWRIPAMGGEPEPVTTPKEDGVTHAFPILFPGKDAIIYIRFTAPTVEASRIEVWDRRADETHVLADQAGALAYLPTGYLIYTQVGSLMAARFDLETLRFSGPHFDVTESRMTDPEGFPTRLAIADNGTLVYVPSGLLAQDSVTLTWLDTSGNQRDIELATGVYYYPRISPDGRWAVYTRMQQNNDLWIMDVERETQSRFTDNPGSDTAGLWMPDGKSILFTSDRSGKWAVYLKSLTDSTPVRKLVESPDTPVRSWAVTSDGSTLIYSHQGDLYAMDLDGRAEPRPLLTSRFAEEAPALSADDRWMAYSSNESGRREVYLRSFPDMGSRFQVSTQGGSLPHWTRDGRLRFTTPGPPREIVEVELGDGVPVSVSELTVIVKIPRLHYLGNMPMSPDGTRYLSARTLGADTLRAGGTEVIVVENWFDEITRNEPVQGVSQ